MLSVHGKTITNDGKEHFDWKDAVIDAAITSGTATTAIALALASTGQLLYSPSTIVVIALTAAYQFLAFIALKRGLKGKVEEQDLIGE